MAAASSPLTTGHRFFGALPVGYKVTRLQRERFFGASEAHVRCTAA